MSASKIGATVLYGGHDASFTADIFQVGNVNVVIANDGLSKPGILQRPASANCTHHVMDHEGGVWKPNRGLFVVPHTACDALMPGAVEKYHGPRQAKKGGRQ